MLVRVVEEPIGKRERPFEAVRLAAHGSPVPDLRGRVVDEYDIWWVCMKPNCTRFFSASDRRDAHEATCEGQPEVPF